MLEAYFLIFLGSLTLLRRRTTAPSSVRFLEFPMHDSILWEGSQPPVVCMLLPIPLLFLRLVAAGSCNRRRSFLVRG